MGEDFSERGHVPQSCLFASGAHRRTFVHASIVSVESTIEMYFRKVLVKLSIIAIMD